MRLAFGLLLVAATISLSPTPPRAEEGLAGHYFPGAIGSFADLAPASYDKDSTPGQTIAISDISTYYHGSSNTFGLNATSYTNAAVLLYQFPGWVPFLPGKAQYSVALGVPYTWLRVRSQAAKDTISGFGDVEMFPLMLSWADYIARVNYPYLQRFQAAFGVYAPTGNFNSGALANVGRNYWTFEPSVAASYLVSQTPTSPVSVEFTPTVGFDFNTKNGATHYQTGDQFHVDGTLAAHLVLFGKQGEATALGGVGVNGYFYQQFTGDSVHGTSIPGGFEGMTTGVGPDLSYLYKNKDGDLTVGAEVKWLPELSVSNRLNGNIVWLKLVVAFGTPAQKHLEAAAAQAPSVPTAVYALPSL